MLFNSFVFILLFLPVCLAVFHGLRRLDLPVAAKASLAAASLVFYGWWSFRALLLLLVLMAANYAAVGQLIATRSEQRRFRFWLTAVAITGNLAVLGYFKYANFFLENVTTLLGGNLSPISVVLPLGLSFFTFQKVALLADAYRGRVRNFEPLGYVLFVSFFPQLIAGPIVHHSEVMPQFALGRRIKFDDVAQGATLFTIGLAKKVLIADSLSHWVKPTFDAALSVVPTLSDAWIASLAYAFQLYFDFSGYSDMAVGLGLMFGIRLPLNFNSPYKADSIIEFWRRWHMTLSRFLRDYVYIPLGGNRRGSWMRYLNLVVTMLLGGLWHGAAWTFVIWGALHALYLVLNHGWIAFRRASGLTYSENAVAKLLSTGVTFLAVLVGWVFFRADDLHSALSMLAAMIGGGGIGPAHGADFALKTSALVVSFAVTWFIPNSAQIVGYRFEEAPDVGSSSYVQWRPTIAWSIASGTVLAACLMSFTRVSEFLYFQF